MMGKAKNEIRALASGHTQDLLQDCHTLSTTGIRGEKLRCGCVRTEETPLILSSCQLSPESLPEELQQESFFSSVVLFTSTKEREREKAKDENPKRNSNKAFHIQFLLFLHSADLITEQVENHELDEGWNISTRQIFTGSPEILWMIL